MLTCTFSSLHLHLCNTPWWSNRNSILQCSGSNSLFFFYLTAWLLQLGFYRAAAARGGAKKELLWKESQRSKQSGNKPYSLFSMRLCPDRMLELEVRFVPVIFRPSFLPACKRWAPYVVPKEEIRNFIIPPPQFIRIPLITINQHELSQKNKKKTKMHGSQWSHCTCGHTVYRCRPQIRKKFLPAAVPVQKMMH